MSGDGAMGFGASRRASSYQLLLPSLLFHLLLLLQFLLTLGSGFFLGLLLRQALQAEAGQNRHTSLELNVLEERPSKLTSFFSSI